MEKAVGHITAGGHCLKQQCLWGACHLQIQTAGRSVFDGIQIFVYRGLPRIKPVELKIFAHSFSIRAFKTGKPISVALHMTPNIWPVFPDYTFPKRRPIS
jgi:hypothetical protein